MADHPGTAAAIFGPLADAAINVDMIVQNISTDGGYTDMTFTVPNDDLARAHQLIESMRENIGFSEVESTSGLAKISIVGVGMRSHAGVAQKMFTELADKSINIQVISTSEIKISVLVDADYTELGVRALHAAFNLDGGMRVQDNAFNPSGGIPYASNDGGAKGIIAPLAAGRWLTELIDKRDLIKLLS